MRKVLLVERERVRVRDTENKIKGQWRLFVAIKQIFIFQQPKF